MESQRLSNNAIFIGTLAETDACDYLEKNGLQLIEKNFSSMNAQGKKVGEIDLIMRDKEFLVFVEVKKRSAKNYGEATEMISKQKQSKIICTATHFLLKHSIYDAEYCRFDIIGISPDKKDPAIQKIEWISDAFQVQY